LLYHVSSCILIACATSQEEQCNFTEKNFDGQTKGFLKQSFIFHAIYFPLRILYWTFYIFSPKILTEDNKYFIVQLTFLKENGYHLTMGYFDNFNNDSRINI
jgi:hypothetical protein